MPYDRAADEALARELPHGEPNSRERDAAIYADFYVACNVPGTRSRPRHVLRTLKMFERLAVA